MTIPSEAECLQLLELYDTPTHVVRHCQAVAATAVQIAEALNQHGANLDVELLKSAALLHDIVRPLKDHGPAGAAIVRRHGYDRPADLIYCHMYYESDPDAASLSEQDLLCLADRMVLEDRYVGYKIRMQAVLERFQDNPAAVQKITARLEETRRLIARIEGRIGRSIDELMRARGDE